jgi:hypothetical protein
MPSKQCRLYRQTLTTENSIEYRREFVSDNVRQLIFNFQLMKFSIDIDEAKKKRMLGIDRHPFHQHIKMIIYLSTVTCPTNSYSCPVKSLTKIL